MMNSVFPPEEEYGDTAYCVSFDLNFEITDINEMG